MELHTYSFTVPRSLQLEDPFLTLHYALRQVQAENALHEMIMAEQLSHDEANFYYKTQDGFTDLVIWANSREDLNDILDILIGRYGWDNDIEVETHPRGGA